MGAACVNLEDWYHSPAKGCKDCYLAILVAWYGDALGPDKVKDIQNLTPEAAIERLEKLKKEFPDKMADLKKLDCYMQQAFEEFK